MERDPVRFVWRAAPGLNALLVALAIFATPCVMAAAWLVAAAIDDAGLGRAFSEGRAEVPFGRLAIPLPERISQTGLVLFPGIPMGREGHLAAIVGGLAALAIGAGLFSALYGTVRLAVGRRATDALARRILMGISSAQVPAWQGAQRSAEAASEAIVGQRGFLGSAVGAPLLGAALLLASLLSLLAADWRLALLSVAGLAVYAAAERVRERTRRKVASADREADNALRRSVTDLATHLSALAAHGTAAHERSRIESDIGPARRRAIRAEREAALASGLMLTLTVGAPVAVFALGGWLSFAGAISPGRMVTAAALAALALGATRRLLRWRRELDLVRPAFAEIARQLGSFHARRRDRPGEALPGSGRLVATGLVADGSIQGSRLAGLDLAIELPSHVALVGDAGSGVRSFAALLGGQILPRAGQVTLGGVDLASAEAPDRARRLAFAGGETFLFPETFEANLLYGCPDADAADIGARLDAALRVAGLSGLVYRRGLGGLVDPRREADLASAVVAARAPIRAALAASGMTDFVQPFDPEAYNPQATIGENILFGISLGDTFRDENLPAHAFMREILDREGLSVPLAALGSAIVRNTLEMFWGVSSRSTIVSRFAILSPSERDEFEIVLSRQGQNRGAAAARDQARLIGLALRYSEVRHRLGLLEPDLSDRILRLRRSFRASLPKSLEPAVEFFDPNRFCAAASLLDNLLFGRIAEDRADARVAVLATVKAELKRRKLIGGVIRIGLRTRIDPVINGLSSAQLAAIDLVRCLVRNPDNLVVQRALDELPAEKAVLLAQRLVAAMAGRGVLIVLPTHAAEAANLFDRAVAFESGRLAGASLAEGSRLREPMVEGPRASSAAAAGQ